MKKLYIIKAGSTFASTIAELGDFEAWIIRALGVLSIPVEVVNAVHGEPLPLPDECCGVLVTGSHAMVTQNLPWSVGIESWIPLLVGAGVPFLGICYGHQLLGRAMGGKVGYHPKGSETGTVTLTLTPEAGDDLLFQDIPSTFRAHATHAQSVLELPSGAVTLARNAHDPHHAFRVGTAAWGVQFHPEYTAAVMQAYINADRDSLSRSGCDVSALLREVTHTPEASGILRKFAVHVERSCTAEG
ncbi:MAG: glutamine amidotransferase [Chlorobium sp.]|jgi:GMP synthase (glutamine-hydrolysing)|nr:glutamine amidotransferase [Chlorobium sp.]